MEHRELEELLELGRGVSLDYDRTKTFVDLFTEQANRTPDNIAVVDKDSQLTYRELDEQSNSIAHWLIEEHDIKPDEFVAVMLPRRKEFVTSVLGIMKAGAAYVPIDPEYPEERRRFMMDDCGAKVVIAEATLNVFRTMQNVTHAAINRANPDVLAYMIYTSGSTGTQKGVMVTHASLCAFAEFRQELIEGKSGDAFAHFTNFSFDASLDDMVTPLVCGGIVHILSESLRRDMDGMARYFTEHRIVGLTLPTRLGMEMLNSYSNLPLRYVMLGGERLNPVSNTNPRIINGYGPTEFTVCSCYHVVDWKKDVENIPIGRPVPNSISLVLDECGNMVSRGMAGELCLAGLQMSKGYWHREELTVEKFVDCPYLKGEKMYRTGDLVRWNEDGELEYIGRIDNQIKLRGYRIELGEIESAAMRINGVSHAVAMVKNDTLCMYYTGTATEESLKSELSKTLPEYMVPGIFIYLEAMPLTPNGKTDRSALPEPETDGEEMVSPATVQEQEIRDIVAEALKTAHFGVTTNLVSVGMTSISAMSLAMKFQQRFGAFVGMTGLMSHPTVREFAVLIDTASEDPRLYGKKHPIQEYYPLTENQKGVYIDWEHHRCGLQYNVASAFKMKDVNPERLAEAIRTVINAHPILKMHLCDVDGEIMQRRDDSMEAVVRVSELPVEARKDAESIEAFFQSRVIAFDLFADNLYRFEIYICNEVTYLFKDIHHIVTDGLSEGRLIEEIFAAYTGKEIYREEYTFYDYALESSSGEEDENYFKELIGDTAATVYPKSIDAEGRGLSRTVSVDIEKSSIEPERSKQGVTANSYILHSLMQVLKSITREERVLIAAVSNGRGYGCMQKCQGFFVKTLPVLSEDSAAELQSQFIQSISHEEFPLTRIVEATGIHPEILYVYQGELHGESLKDRNFESISLSLDTPKMPISIFVNPDLDDKYIITAEYDDSLYSDKEMLMLLHCVRTMSVEGRLVTEEEERQLIELGKGEQLEYDRSKTFIDLFTEQAERTPDSIAVVDKDSQITYKELDEQSNAIAHWLMEEYDIKPNDFVAVMLPRRKEFVTAVLGIWKAGAAYVPIDTEYPSERKRFILADCGAKVVLSRESFAQIRTDFRILRVSFAQNTKTDNLAYMIYTSGSTGVPKGVMIGHKGLVNYALASVRICGLSASDRIAAHFSFSFSAHLIDFYPVLAAGATVFIIPEEDRKDTERLYQFFATHRISGCYLPSSLASLMYNQYTLHLRYLGATGEKVQGMVSGKNGVQVINGYGSSEGTDLTSTYTLLYGVDYQSNVPIGRPMPNCQVLIVDNSLRLVPRGEAGELCFAGCQVGKGYWHNPELTAEKFVDCPYVKGEKMYRTGDLVRWNEEGLLEYIGRIDNQIKLRGYRIELGEIESAATKLNGISQAVAMVKNDILCLYYTGEAAGEDLRASLSGRLPDYMLPGIFIHLETMPLTPNGKTDRKALPEPEAYDEETVLPATVQEQEILDLVAEALNTSHFGVTTNLVSVGMTSIAAMRLAMKLQRRFNASVRMTDLMSHPTVRELAKQIETSSKENCRYGTIYPVQDYYPLTENQKGVYIDWERHRYGHQYNVSYALKLKDINPEKFAEAITTVIDAHPVLKMRLCDVDGEIMQRRDDSTEAVVTVSELPVEVQGDAESIKAFFQSRVRAFDLFNDTLYRFEIYTFNEVTYLFRDIHHIVTDGLSEGRLIAEIFDAYYGKENKKEEYTFYDYALESTPKYEDETYFKELIGGTEATVYPRSRDADGNGRSRTVSIEMDKAAMEKERRREGVTASNHILHSLLQVLKSITREDRALIAAVSNGRSFSCMQKCQGFFVKTLPVLSEESAADLQHQFIQSIGHEEYPLTQIVESTGIHPGILYAYQGELLGESLKNSDIEPIFLSLDTPKMPISIIVDPDSDDKYILSAEFDDSLYTEKDMLTLLTCVRTMATEGRLITEDEEQQLIALGIGETLDYDTTKTFVDLFTEQALRTPDNIAVVDKDSQITYRELDEQSNAIAHWLIEEHDIQPNDFVAVMLPRRKEFVTAVLGIWKAGAAYVPIDPEYPSERKRFILADSGAKVVLSRESFVKLRTDFRILRVSFAQNTKTDNLAYMIYTSGSTGVPKGVMIQHKALVNFVQFQKHYWPITPESRISSHTSFSFDASNKDLFVPLVVGASLYIIPEDMRHDTEAIINYTELHGITGGNFVTPIGELLLQTERLKLDYVCLGGEKLRNKYAYEGHLFNTYGPTEFTIDATWIELGQDTGTEPPIGRPVPNTYAFVLDKKMGLVPRGVPGELCLAGIQIFQGYWHREELTAEKFVDCPYLQGEKMYRTGDLVRWNEDGQLEYIGRIDNQIKLRGYRIELGEIESAAMKTVDVSQSVAMAKNDTLCLYYTGEATEDGLRASLSERLPDYMLPGIFIHLETMPLTSNGKIDRKALPEPEIQQQKYIAPANERERIIAESVSAILGLTEPISAEERFVLLGGNSISAMRLSSLLRKESLRIGTADILRLQTVRAIAAAAVFDDAIIEGMTSPGQEKESLTGVPLHESARFSYLGWERDHDTLKNNMPTAMHFSKHPSDVVKPALEKLFAAHPYINVRLYLSDGVPYQRLDRDLAVEITHRLLASPPDEPFFKSLVRPYNLIESPLYRIELIESAGMEGCWLFIDINHVICDGYSKALLLRDLSRVLAGDELHDVETGALKHSGYEQKHQCDLTSHDSYFDGLMRGISPTVFPLSHYGRGDYEVVYSKVPADLVRSYVRLVGITENNVFLTAVLSVLQRLTDSEDVSLTMGHSGRGNPEISESVGMFVKTWPVVGRSINTLSWREATESIQEQVLNTSSLEYYPFERLLSRYGWHPEITFIYEGNMEYSGVSIPGAGFVSSVWNYVPSMTPVWIGATLQDDSYVLAVKYDGQRYSGRDMRRLADFISETVIRGCRQPESVLGESELLSESERQEIMALSSGETVPYDTSKTCVDAIVSNALRYPDYPAIVACDGSLTYRELDARSNIVANRLISDGIQKGSFVAMRLPEGTDFYIAALGIMKAGCGYIPMDITYPEERLDFMLRDSGAAIVITPELMNSILNAVDASSAPVNLSEPDGPSMLLYTSGSTGEPKGAYQQHKSLWTMVAGYIHDFEMEHGYYYAAVTSPSYALSLPDTYGTLCAGATLYISGPELRKDISALADYINDNNIRGFGISTALGSALINSGISLGIEYMILAGEKVGSLKHTDYALWNGLGSTETHYMSYHRIDGTEEVIPLGHPAPNMKALLLDSRGQLVPRGYTGELCIEGEQLVKGYWHREELTSSRFRDGVYHTGDLAYWNEDGELMPAGRKDNMVKVRGYRIELEEIERCAMKVMGVTGAAAAVRGTSSEPVICLFYTGESEVDFSGMERALPRFMLPSRFVRLESLPLNVRGKLDRSALPELKAGHSSDIISPLTATEQQIYDLVSIILGTDDFGVTTDLLKAGLSSIGAMKLCFALDSQGIGKLHVSEILNHPTVREIAGLCKRLAGTSEFIFGTVHPKREYYPMTQNQLGIYIDWQRNPDGIQYNNPSVTFLPETSADDIVRITTLLTDAHPYLKCRIETVDGTPMQHRRDEATPDVLIGSIPSNTDPGAFFQSRVRPFDLEGGELCRVEVYPTDGGCWLFTDLHHIITDGYSDGLRSLDIKRLLSDGEVAQESYTAYDYAVEEEEYSHTEAYAADREYFRQLLEGLDTTVYPGTASGTATGLGKETLSLPKAAVREGAFENGVTANVFILSRLSSLLKSVTREERVLLATVSSGRESRSMEHTQGFFVKTLPVVYESDMSSLQRQLSESISHQQYPFTEMVSSFGIRPSVLYTFEGGLGITGKREGLSLDTAKFPLSITVYPAEEEYYIECEYDRSMYSDGDIQTLLHCLETMVLTGRLVTEEEERQLIELGTGEKLDYDRSKTFIDLFTEQVCRTPDNIAVVDKDSQITYRELDEQSDAVAHWLLEEHDIKPNDFVAVMLPRRKEFVTAVLGIWKAGAAYVPVDPEYPEERKRFILADSGAKVVLSRESFVKIRTDFRILRVSFAQNTKPDNLAYMIYTSGSTGVPKGAMLSHGGLLNYILSTVKINGIGESDRVSAYRSFSFDSHIEEFYPSLATGASVYIIHEAIRKDLASISEYLSVNKISACYFPTSIAVLLYNSADLSVRFIGAVGEKLTGVVSGKNGVRFLNTYGPTECTDHISTYWLEDGREYGNTPIGRPLANGKVFVVDSSLHLLPKGMAGELCFNSIQLSRGYWHRKELTAEKFVDCPYLPGEKMYRTGDLVRWNDDGNLEYIGRIDNQVKLRGYRIELGEIESAAAKVEGVSQAIAAVKNDTLCLYYTGTVTEESIKSEMSRTLPEHMIPGIFIHMETMPLTPNGKTDRSALPELEIQESEYVGPGNVEETLLCEMIKQVLGITTLGVKDNLKALGMNSIKAMKVMAAMHTIGFNGLKLNHIIRASDVIDLIRLKNNNIDECGSWLGGLDGSKPAIVLCCGVISDRMITDYLNSWRERYNIYIIQPVFNSWPDYLDIDETQMLERYYRQLRKDIPKNTDVEAFVGFSFGGELAYHLADRWGETNGTLPTVLMGDTMLAVDDDSSGSQVLDEIGKKWGDYSISALAAFFNGFKRLPLPEYKGRIVLLSSAAEGGASENEEQWRGICPGIEIIRTKESHLELFGNESNYRMCLELLKDGYHP